VHKMLLQCRSVGNGIDQPIVIVFLCVRSMLFFDDVLTERLKENAVSVEGTRTSSGQ